MERVFVRAPFAYDTMAASDEVAIGDFDKSKTQQQFKEECDVNTIVERFGLTGQLPQDVRMPVSGDFTGVFDFHSAMNSVRLATESFNKMPATVRARFHHDPGEFADFCANKDNYDEAVKLGLISPESLAAKAAAAAQAAAATAATGLPAAASAAAPKA